MRVEACRRCRSVAIGPVGFECRRKAPTAVAIATRDGVTRLAVWPPVRANDWCHDYAFSALYGSEEFKRIEELAKAEDALLEKEHRDAEV